MNLDEQSVKNVAEKTQLNSALRRIEREEKAEMRMHNTSKQRFKAKYARLDNYITNGITQAPSVRLYETHNPGFCYRRNGERRLTQIINSNLSVDFQDLHTLLFTEGEVDIEKVLCLHLLAVHRTETLTPPSRYNRTSFLSKEQSPLERLIERSKKKHQIDNLTELLPTYVLDVTSKRVMEEGKQKKSDIVIRDGRLAARVIVNDKIVQLVHTVIAALQNSNPEKMKELLTTAMDQESVRKIFEKSHIQEFLKNLKTHSFLSSCESFHLTQPFKILTIPLEIETSNGRLENLVKQIRKDVLQSTEKSFWKTACKKMENLDLQQSETETDRAKKRDASPVSQKTERGSEVIQPPRAAKTSVVMKNKEVIIEQKEPRRAPRSPRLQSPVPRSSSRNPEDDNTEKINRATTYSDIFRNMNIKALATELSRKANKEHKRDLAQLTINDASTRDVEESNEQLHQDSLQSKESQRQAKVSIKRMNCAACQEKWKVPPPKPKIPNYKRVAIPAIQQAGNIEHKSASSHRLSILIDQETKKLNEEARRAFPRKKAFLKIDSRGKSEFGRVYGKKIIADVTDLNAIDLARIGQEIKEIETKKKLAKFLEKKL